jgi:dTDP-4-dehydrorhamnose 3,5-epimerase
MQITESPLKDCFIIEAAVYKDNRGYFLESFNQKKFQEKSGLDTVFVQDNESFSRYGVIRGMHFQKGEFAQSKLVRAVKGEVLDVVVDFRAGSATFGQHFSIILNDENKKQLFVPKGFLHGFSVLSEDVILSYKCDEYYVPAAESGIRFDDPTFNIDWKIPEGKRIVSEKDLALPFLDTL